MPDLAWKHDSEGYFVEMRCGARKDYAIDWTDWLGTDAIAGVNLTVPTGITLLSTPAVSGKVVQFVFLAGAAGAYACSFQLTSAAGLVELFSFRVLVRA